MYGTKIRTPLKPILERLRDPNVIISHLSKELKGKVGRSTLYRIAHENGITPSWKKR